MSFTHNPFYTTDHKFTQPVLTRTLHFQQSVDLLLRFDAPINTKIGHFEDVLPTQSFTVVPKTPDSVNTARLNPEKV